MSERPPRREWRADEAAEGERLDRHAADKLGLARHQIQRWIRAGQVLVDGRPARASHRLAAGEAIVCQPLPTADVAFRPEAGELAVLHQERAFAVLDKPAGLAVHRGAGRSGGTLANRILARYPETAEVGGPGRPGIVHRLDIDTTGVLIVARTPAAYQALSRAFAERRVSKTYLAIAYGTPEPAAGRIERPIGRDPRDRKRMAVRPGGRPARTDYRVRQAASGVSLLELRLVTGRTHQIRVHLKSEGHPLVGDPIYGEARWRGFPPSARPALRSFPRPALHAWRLELDDPTADEPTTARRLRFEAPPPADLAALWLRLTGAELRVENR